MPISTARTPQRVRLLYRIFFGILILAAVTGRVHAQVYEAWTRPFKLTQGQTSLKAQTTDDNANVYLTGFTTPNGGNVFTRRFLTQKISPAGALLWEQEYRLNSGSANATGIAVDKQGNVYVGGEGNNSAYRLIIVKYDPNGALLWAKNFAPAPTQQTYSAGFGIDAAGNAYLASYTFDNSNQSKSFLTKYDAGGNFQWTAERAGSEWRHLAVGQQGQIAVTGVINGATTQTDFITGQYDGQGVLQWADAYAVTPGHDNPNGIAVDAAGNVVVAGDCNNGMGTVHYSPQGVRQWADVYYYPGPSATSGTAVATDSKGNVLVAGYTFPGSDADYLTLKYGADGTLLWTRTYSYLSTDIARAVALDAKDNIYVTGDSYNFSNPDAVATIKYDPAGNLLWDIRTNNRYANGISLDPFGGVIVTGEAYVNKIQQEMGTPRLAISNVSNLVRANGIITADVTLTNSGGASAKDVTVTAAALGAAQTTSSLPAIARILPGQSATVTLSFPASAGASGAKVYLKLSARFVGGNITSSRRVTLP